MNRGELAIFTERLHTLGQDVKSDFAGRSVGYRLYVRANGTNAVVLTSAREAEAFTKGLEMKQEKEAKRGS